MQVGRSATGSDASVAPGPLQRRWEAGLPLRYAGTAKGGRDFAQPENTAPGRQSDGSPPGSEQRQHRAEAGVGGFLLPSQLLLVHGFSSHRGPCFGAVRLSVSVSIPAVRAQQSDNGRAHPQAPLEQGDVRGNGKKMF